MGLSGWQLRDYTGLPRQKRPSAVLNADTVCAIDGSRCSGALELGKEGTPVSEKRRIYPPLLSWEDYIEPP